MVLIPCPFVRRAELCLGQFPLHIVTGGVVFSFGLSLIKTVATIKAYSKQSWLRTTERTFRRRSLWHARYDLKWLEMKPVNTKLPNLRSTGTHVWMTFNQPPKRKGYFLNNFLFYPGSKERKNKKARKRTSTPWEVTKLKLWQISKLVCGWAYIWK